MKVKCLYDNIQFTKGGNWVSIVLTFVVLRYGNSDFSDRIERVLISVQIALLNKPWHTVIASPHGLKHLLPTVHYLQNVLAIYGCIATNAWEKYFQSGLYGN